MTHSFPTRRSSDLAPALPVTAHRRTHHQKRPQTNPTDTSNMALGNRTRHSIPTRPGHTLTIRPTTRSTPRKENPQPGRGTRRHRERPAATPPTHNPQNPHQLAKRPQTTRQPNNPP